MWFLSVLRGTLYYILSVGGMVIVRCTEYRGCPPLGGSLSINAMLNFNPCHRVCPLYRGCPLLGCPLWEVPLYTIDKTWVLWTGKKILDCTLDDGVNTSTGGNAIQRPGSAYDQRIVGLIGSVDGQNTSQICRINRLVKS